MKTYYMANPEHADKIYGSEIPVCIDMAEIERLAHEWDMTTAELLKQFHEANAAEIEELGIYEG